MTWNIEQRGRGREREWIRPLSLESLRLFMKLQHNISNGSVLRCVSCVQAFTFYPNENWRCVICLHSVISVPTNGIIPFSFFTSRRHGDVVFQADVHALHTFLIAFWCKWCNMMADSYILSSGTLTTAMKMCVRDGETRPGNDRAVLHPWVTEFSILIGQEVFFNCA